MEKCPVLDVELKNKIKKTFPTLVLASQSPNRLNMLRDCGVTVIVRPQDINEICGLTEPSEVVRLIATQKMRRYMGSSLFDSTLPAVSADTLVCLGSTLHGKPKDEEEAVSMYRLLSGKKHSVLSGLCMYLPGRGMMESCCVVSDVYFKTLSERDIERYICSGDYKGVAGAYRIQSQGYTLMEKISGSLSNIIGLPLEKMLELALQ